jgi:hypothetical protein
MPATTHLVQKTFSQEMIVLPFSVPGIQSWSVPRDWSLGLVDFRETYYDECVNKISDRTNEVVRGKGIISSTVSMIQGRRIGKTNLDNPNKPFPM